MSIGTDRVGLDFNPSGIPEITQVKEQTAGLIDMIDDLRQNMSHDSECVRICSKAMTELEDGCMWAVKAIARAAHSPIVRDVDLLSDKPDSHRGPADLPPQGE